MENDTKPTDEKIKIFRSLSSGRENAYGLESPKGPIAVREPLTDSLIIDHIRGSKRIGSYPILLGDVVRWAVIDVDEDMDLPTDKAISKSKDEATRAYVACIENNLFCYLEKSKKRGFHIWIFFDEPILAKKVRKVLLKILKTVGLEHLEVFPKQESLSSDNGLGNFVYLFLHGQSAKESRTVFLNSQFQPYENQWEHLSKINRTRAENILSMAEEIPEEPKVETSDSKPEDFLDLQKYLAHYGVSNQEKKEPSRNIYKLGKCLFGENHTTGDGKGHAAIIQGIDKKLTYHCMHDHCKNRKWEDARKAISGDDPIVQFYEGYQKANLNKARSKRNLAEDLKLWIENSYGTFTTSQVYNDLDIKTVSDKTFIRVNLHRLAERGEIERGISNGTFRKIDRNANVIVIEDTVSTPLPLKWPGELEKYVKIMRKSTVGVAGTMQAGKTAYLLNTAWENRDLMPTCYFTSEFGAEELRERLEGFHHSLDQWRKITFVEKSRDFQDVINPDGLNLIDYVEVSDEGEFYKMGIQIKRIYEKLNNGVAVIGLQKKFGSDFGYGGQPTADKPRLYITLQDKTLKIVKAKLWATEFNPDGMTRRFKLVQGARFIWESWEKS